VHRSRHRARGWIALLIVLLLTAIALTAGWYYAKGRFTTAPALTSMSRVKAQTIAEESGLQVDFSQRYSETVPAGVVIDTRPRPGGKILRGGLIDAVVSKGPERFPMPKVVGLSRTAAEAALTRSHLATGSVDRRYSETVAKDIVLDASVDTGKPLKRDTRIDLVVSAGRRPIPVTDFTGKAADEAAAALKKAGFTVQVSTEHSDTVPQGSVIRQSPKSGTGHKDDEINLVQSLGPELVTVPQVKSWGVEAAKKKLEDEGFQVRTAHSSLVYLGLGYVESTDPAGGTKARKGSTVTLNLI
jgi:serine/threonine-protein kinase